MLFRIPRLIEHVSSIMALEVCYVLYNECGATVNSVWNFRKVI
jgi:hypothetical protein